MTLEKAPVKQQVQKVLWTRKAPACLLTLLHAYGKPRLLPVHKYSSLHSTAHRAVQQAAALDAGAYKHCAGSKIIELAVKQ